MWPLGHNRSGPLCVTISRFECILLIQQRIMKKKGNIIGAQRSESEHHFLAVE